jgi:glycosyltransferase involved in cell wall biosynthesis
MKILIVSDHYPPYIKGGAEVSTSLLAEWLTKQHQVVVACSQLARQSWQQRGIWVHPIFRKANVGSRGVRSAFLYAFGIAFLPLVSAGRIVRLAHRQKPDIAQVVPSTYQFVPTIIALRLLCRVPVVVDCRDYSLICPTHLSSETFNDVARRTHGYRCLVGYRPQNRLLALLAAPFALYESLIFNLNKYAIKLLVRHDKGVRLVAISAYVKKQLQSNGFASNAIQVVPNMLISSQSTPAKRRSATFVYAGRIERSKGVWDLVEAARQLRAAGHDFELQIVGSGSDEQALRAYVATQHLDYVSFTGRVSPEDVIELYARALAIMAPSRWPEPFGRFIQEAHLAHTPIIASRTGGIAEGVADGQTGLLVKPGNTRQLAKAMEQLLTHPEQVRAMSKQLAASSSQYAPDTIGARRLHLYNALIS